MTAINLPREVLRALRGHKAGPGKVLGHDGARPVWTSIQSGLVIVSPTAPSSPATGQLWYDTSPLYPVAVSDDSTGVSGTSDTLTFSLGSVLEGDLLLLAEYKMPSPATPAGWSVLRSDSLSGGFGKIYSRVADAGDVGTVNVSVVEGSGAGYYVGAAFAWRGAQVDTSGANSGHSGTPTSLSLVAPSVTPSTDATLLCLWATQDTAGAGFTAPGGMTTATSYLAAYGSILAATENVAAGATGTRTATQGSSVTDALNWSVALTSTGSYPLKLWDGSSWVVLTL